MQKLNSALLALFALTLLTFGATTAHAAKNQQTVIEDPARVLSPDPAARTASLNETAALGADLVKISVTWRAYAPDGMGTTKPAADLSDPANYPAGTWDRLDEVVAGAQARGLKVWLTPTAPAPRWAVAKETSPGLGAYRPDAAAFGDFVEAIGRRYPTVHFFSIWTEPNLKRFLQPQARSGVIESAVHYRALFLAAQGALRASGHATDPLLFGELMPRSPASRDPQFSPPLAWLREFFCIDRNGRALRGKTARRHGCSKFKKISAAGLAYHPYRLSGSPLSRETANKDYAAVNYMPRVQRVLDAAYKARHLAQRRMKIYSSEFGFQTNPPEPIGASLTRVASYLNISEYLNWSDSRVATYSQYLLVDDTDLGAFQTGLRFTNGEIKPAVYEAFQTPFLAMRTRSANRVTLWGGMRAKPAGTQPIELQYQSGDEWKTAKTLPVSTNHGYYKTTVALSGAKSKHWRAVWSGGTSRSTRPIAEVKPRRD